MPNEGGTFQKMNTVAFLSIPAMMFPDQEALVFEDTRFTYGQLSSRVACLAKGLRSLGLGRGSRIGIIQTNCNQYVEAYYACSKIGGTFVPLNYRAKAEELKHMVNTAKVDTLMMGERYSDLALSMRSDFPSVKHWIALDEPRAGLLYFEDII